MIVSSSNRPDGLFAAAMVALMAGLLTARLAEAHGDGGTVQLIGQTVADHDVTVMTAPKRPRIGALHVAVQLVDPHELTYIETATVTATARFLGDENIRVRSKRSCYGEPWHELDLDLKRSGPWQVKLYVDGPNGQGESSFRVNISPDPD